MSRLNIPASNDGPLFVGCTRRENSELARFMTAVCVPGGRTLMTEGERGRDFVIIDAGSAEVRRGGSPVSTLGPGEFFGELSLLTGGVRTATVQANTDMVLRVLDAREFSAVLQRNPMEASRILGAAVERLATLAA
jgi:CRP-like cAMP-binding protein